MTPALVVVAAVARNRVIGGNNQLLWRLPVDLAHFRGLTLGKPMIMGRKTFASIGRALPKRETIVVTRDRQFAVDGVWAVHTIGRALELGAERARAMGVADLVLAGGGELYAAMMDRADRLHITEVDLEPDGDALFPLIDPERWREISRVTPALGPNDAAACQFVDYVRR